MDHGDHDPPWWTRSVQDHLGPSSDISLMLMVLLEDILSAPVSSRFKGNRIISVSDDELNTALITPYALPIDKKERKSMITVSTKLNSNLPYC